MDATTLEYIIEQPNENGFIIFLLGILFVLSVYHFLLYFQHKDKSYLYYSLYTFLILSSHLYNVRHGFIPTLVDPIRPALDTLYFPIMWLYNTVYFLFSFTFADLKKNGPRWNFFFSRILIFLLILIPTLTILFFREPDTLTYISNVFMIPFFIILGIIAYIPFFTLRFLLRNYIIAGSLVLFTSSITSHVLWQMQWIKEGSDITYMIFYVGIIIEVLIFSLGLGYKQKLILQEKNTNQQKLIKQLKENEVLRKTVHQQLEKDVLLISQQAEEANIESIKANFEKELVKLKMASLRSQMNPHFIFNSLNSIKLYIIDHDTEKAVYYLNKFSKLIRKILEATQEKEFTLAKEIETAQLYLNIENIRFSNEIKTEISIEDSLNLNTIKVPALFLQPFIENAIWHGLSPKAGPKKINISFTKEEDTHMIVTILDNGIGRKKSSKVKANKLHKRQSIGIQLTKERLANFCIDYTNKYSLELVDLYDDISPLGTKVIIRIPLI